MFYKKYNLIICSMLVIINLCVILCPQITFAADNASTQISLTVPKTEKSGSHSTSNKPVSTSTVKQSIIPETGDKHLGEIMIYFGTALISVIGICILADNRKKNF